MLDIRVLNAKLGRLSSDIIGSFEIDLGMIFDQPGNVHSTIVQVTECLQ